MDYVKLYEIIFKIYTDCEVTAFPIDCFDIVLKRGYRIKKYSELTQKKREACLCLSPDSCIVKDTLYYQDQNTAERIRFSIMHELGHVFLQTSVEEMADTFSSHILAPRIAIHKSRCHTAQQIHDTFALSYTASNKALLDYKVWYENIAHTTRMPSPPEKQLELLLFSEKNNTPAAEDPFTDDNIIYTPDPITIYQDIQRALMAGLPLTEEYKRLLNQYRNMR